MIVLDRVSKAFQRRLALDAVSLEVARGEVLAVLGPNGAGKTTMLSLLLGFLRPTSGNLFVRGISVRRHPRRAREGMGSVLAPAFYDYLSGWENLAALTSYSAAVAPADMLDAVRFVGLAERIHDPVGAYSYGMRRRLALAQALLPSPDVVLLDEPEEGLDPEGIRDMRRSIVGMNRARGVTVLLASHRLDGVEEMCDRIAILDRGRLIFAGRWQELGGDDSTVRLVLDDWEKAGPVLVAIGARVLDDHVVSLPPGCDVADLVQALVRAAVRVRAVEPVQRTLEDCYLRALATARTSAS